jgi:hypothetical protein
MIICDLVIFAYLFKSFKSKNKILKISKISLILSQTIYQIKK